MERHEGPEPSGSLCSRSTADPDGTDHGHDRRRFLRGLGAGISVGATLPALSGCLGVAAESVSLLAAGSLAHTFEDHVGPVFEERTGLDLHGEYYGSNAVMRMVEDGTKHPDVVVSADATLLRDRLYDGFVDWDLEFATNVLGIGYNPDTDLGEGLERGEPWHEQVRELSEGDLTIGEPDLDPLGYRAVQAFELAEAKYGLDGFREEMLEATYREPEEPQMMAGVSAGARAGAVVYGNMAVDHGMPFHEFPSAYNFAEPELADHYATAVFVTDEEEYEAVGRPILYNAAVPEGADTPDAGRQLVEFLMERPDVLIDAGLRVPDSLPRAFGDLPEEVAS